MKINTIYCPQCGTKLTINSKAMGKIGSTDIFYTCDSCRQYFDVKVEIVPK